jgi:hypothetical protein
MVGIIEEIERAEERAVVHLRVGLPRLRLVAEALRKSPRGQLTATELADLRRRK